jgi:hypothetical protein
MLYILDELYQRSTIVEDYESLIWTERLTTWGDFEIRIASTFTTRRLFIPDKTLLRRDNSYRVMVVESVEDVTSDDGKAMLKVIGRSFERVLDDRIAISSLSNTENTAKWNLGCTPVTLVEFLFIEICLDGILSNSDILMNTYCGNSIYPPDTIAAPSETVQFSIEPKSVYAAIKTVCEQFSMGFRLSLGVDSNPPYFEFGVYMGRDLTTAQNTNTPVIFSPQLENLENPSSLKTTTKYKNVAYVVTPVGSTTVTLTQEEAAMTDVERRVLLVIATDITDTNPAIALEQMAQRGIEELAKNVRVSMVDGAVNEYKNYTYGVDYHLNDLVEVQNPDGGIEISRVTEHIYVDDAEGERSYPTLTAVDFVTPGTWSSWVGNRTWADAGESEHWADV